MPEDRATTAQLDRVVALARHVLGADLLGVYLHGSVVAGGLRPDSDLDLLAVVEHPLAPHQRAALIGGLLPISGRGDPSGRSRSVELTVVRQDAVRPWRYPPPLELQYGDWWRHEFEAGVEAPWASPNPDLAIAVAGVLAADRPLVGPPAAELLDPVPAWDVALASVAGIDALLADLEPDTRNVLLTLARAWLTVATGRVAAKDEAARWAAERLGPADRAVVRRAAAAYRAGGTEPWDDEMAAARHCAETMAAAAREAADRSPGMG